MLKLNYFYYNMYMINTIFVEKRNIVKHNEDEMKNKNS